MESIKGGLTVLLVMLSLVIEGSVGDVYKVGDSAGWTTIGNVNYLQWAVIKTFQVGDVIVFEYNPQFHNVMQVTHPEYQSCNASSPISTHTTGNDSISITTHGHHFFLCGVPGHCQAGQKIDINVLRAPSVSSSPSGSPPPFLTVTVPTPSPSIAARPRDMVIGNIRFTLLFLIMTFVFNLNSTYRIIIS